MGQLGGGALTTKEAPDARGLAALILGASLLGFAAMLVRWASPAGPLVVGFYRMLFALPFVALLARGQNEVGTLGMQLRLTADLAGQEVHTTAFTLRQAARDVQQPARAWSDPERLLFGAQASALGPGDQ